MPLFDRHIVVDWSARSTPSPAAPCADAIWIGVAGAAPEYVRTRAGAVARLAEICARARADGARVLIGFDFPFGYPGGVAERITGAPRALALWDWLAARVNDQTDNANTRYQAAAAINRLYPGLGPFWGRPATWDHPEIPTRARSRHGAHPPERRLADARAQGAKTVWQLAGAGAVGSQVLLGLPALKALRDGHGARVWPFDTGLRTPAAQIVLAEVYPSLLRNEIAAQRDAGGILDADQVRITAQALARLDAQDAFAPLFSGAEGLTPADRRVIEEQEAWILGLGHETALRAAATPGIEVHA